MTPTQRLVLGVGAHIRTNRSPRPFARGTGSYRTHLLSGARAPGDPRRAAVSAAPGMAAHGQCLDGFRTVRSGTAPSRRALHPRPPVVRREYDTADAWPLPSDSPDSRKRVPKTQ